MRAASRWGLPTLLMTVLSLSGCFVSTARYEEKVREADAIRDALAAANKGKVTAEARVEALQKEVSDAKGETGTLSATLASREEELRKANEELALAQKSYEGTRITREQLISELMEKEKATGKRISELATRLQECDISAEESRKEMALREAEIADIRARAGATPETEALRRERDTLLGRVERLVEERRMEEKKRTDRFHSLTQSLGGLSPPVPVAILGATARVAIPEKEVGSAGKPRLSDAARGIVSELGQAAAELNGASIIITAGAGPVAEEIRGLLVSGAKMIPERVLVSVRERERGAELLLVAP